MLACVTPVPTCVFNTLTRALPHVPTSCQPLTYLMLDVSKSIRRLEDGTIVVPILPQMS
jgi:hypothetical protein